MDSESPQASWLRQSDAQSDTNFDEYVNWDAGSNVSLHGDETRTNLMRHGNNGPSNDEAFHNLASAVVSPALTVFTHSPGDQDGIVLDLDLARHLAIIPDHNSLPFLHGDPLDTGQPPDCSLDAATPYMNASQAPIYHGMESSRNLVNQYNIFQPPPDQQPFTPMPNDHLGLGCHPVLSTMTTSSRTYANFASSSEQERPLPADRPAQPGRTDQVGEGSPIPGPSRKRKREKRKMCDRCRKKFYCRRELNRHKQSNHTPLEDRIKYVCEDCEHAFLREDTLRTHQKKSCSARA